jgi:hypothetical protein
MRQGCEVHTGINIGPKVNSLLLRLRNWSRRDKTKRHIAYVSKASRNSSGGLAVKRITSNDEIPGSSPGRSSFFLFFFSSLREIRVST